MKKCKSGEEQNYIINCEAKLIQQASPKKPFKFIREQAIRKQNIDVTQIYQIGQKIGSGCFGEVFKVKHKILGLSRAMKIIKKSEKSAAHNSIEQLQILKLLDHPNVLKIYQYFQNEHEWQIITEFFQGKQLFEQIITDKKISERKAATIFIQICKALSYIHSHNIVHRDIKPENILVRRQGEGQYKVKLIDWGLGSKYVQQLIRKCGTPQYCAPEVIKGSYGLQCDLWSLGVLLYIMLIGKFPFKGNNARQTLILVLKGQYNFDNPDWNIISTDAKILISKLLKKEAKLRISAVQCLKQPWLVKNMGLITLNPQIKLNDTLQRLKQVNYDNKFQSIVVNIIKNYLRAPEQEQQMKRQFQSLDENKDGVLSFHEIQKAYMKVYSPIQAKRITEFIFEQIDLDNSNNIQYSQFIAFGTKINKQFSKEQLEEVFRQFDSNKDGKIDKKQLSSFIFYQKVTESQDFDQLLNQIDVDKDGSINIEQFMNTINIAVRKSLSSSQFVNQKQTQLDQYKLAINIYENNRKIKKDCSTQSKLTQKSLKQQQDSQKDC